MANEDSLQNDAPVKAPSQKLIAVHDRAMKRFNKIQSALRDERIQCLQDRRFYSIAGAQWEGPLGLQFENRPKLEVNKIHLAVIRIINEYRANRITVNFVPKDGVENTKLVDMAAGVFRADEQDSVAEEAYDNGFEEAVGGGFGAFRLRTDYIDDDNDDDAQRIKFEPIVDADSSVFFDIDSKRQDKSDAKYCFVLTAMSRDGYEEEYEDFPASWPKLIYQFQNDWLTPDVVYVAEYYEIEEAKVLTYYYQGLAGDDDIKKYTDDDFEQNEDLKDTLKSSGYKKFKEKRIKTTKVHKYMLSAASVIEDCKYIIGKNIPIVPIYGKRWFIDNVERCMGHVRLAKDAQRLKNMQLSKLAEISAQSTVEKPVFTPEQMLGHGVMWAEDNLKNYPYLLINALTGPDGTPTAVGAQSYTKAPQIPPAMAALLQITEEDIKDILGNQEAGEQVQANQSGLAIELVQAKLDMQVYIYVSNMEKAVKRAGEIWLDMAKKCYVEKGRKLKSLDKNKKVSSVEIGEMQLDNNGLPKQGNQLSEASFDCTAEAGPTSASKRAAIAKSLFSILSAIQDPQTAGIVVSLILMNLEGEGLSDVHAFFRKNLVRMGVIPPTPDEMKEMQQEAQAAQQNQQPDAQTTYLQAAAEAASATAHDKLADAVLKAAKVDKLGAETEAIKAGIGNDKVKTHLAAVDTVGKRVDATNAHHLAALETVGNRVDAQNAHDLAKNPPPAPQK